MKLFNLGAALILGCGVPLLTQALAPSMAVAVTANARPEGTFGDGGEWYVTLVRQDNSYRYIGQNHKNDSSIELAGAKVSGTDRRRIYTWNNKGTKYQVVWQSKDPDYIRVKVISNSGKTVLNRLFSRIEGCSG
jgi:hypothetical protein